MRQAEQIEHKGRVLSVGEDVVRVAIEVNEACGSCASRKACAMGQGTTREIVVYTDEASQYAVGEVVDVAAHRSAGVMAVVLCYVVPLVVLVVALALLVVAGCNEGVAALVSLAVTAIYYSILGIIHKRISKRIVFTINKL